ncbi:hypothetical protein PsorP6_010254 [Peronosclerospora sorghi]|uniref:Uncharacterized protein n=1 Tax=Peronosclerospora sorghi TaxID=230839 RepID=A0ACC0VWJ0_9STRA|nr:hypothetical protein PsorP6_010254 [Peronosclerospora sorghi]
MLADAVLRDHVEQDAIKIHALEHKTHQEQERREALALEEEQRTRGRLTVNEASTQPVVVQGLTRDDEALGNAVSIEKAEETSADRSARRDVEDKVLPTQAGEQGDAVHVFYDVRYVLGGFDRHVASEYVHSSELLHHHSNHEKVDRDYYHDDFINKPHERNQRKAEARLERKGTRVDEETARELRTRQRKRPPDRASEHKDRGIARQEQQVVLTPEKTERDTTPPTTSRPVSSQVSSDTERSVSTDDTSAAPSPFLTQRTRRKHHILDSEDESSEDESKESPRLEAGTVYDHDSFESQDDEDPPAARHEKTSRRQKPRTPRTSREDTRGHEQDPSAPNQLVARVQYLLNLQNVVAAVLPGCKDVQEVEEELKKWQQVEKETQELWCELEHARQEADEVKRTLQDDSEALETMRIEMKRVKEREAMRQEEDAVLLEQQLEACQAMEQLVRESDQVIQRMVDSAARQAEEIESLRQEIKSLNADKERLVPIHLEEVEELQGQLTRAMDTLSTKTTEHEDAQTQEIQTLQTYLASMKVEKETLVKETMDELKNLQCQLYRALMCEKAHARAIEELQEKLKSRTPATSTDGNEDKKESTTNEVQRRGEADEDTQDTDTSEAEEREAMSRCKIRMI